MRGREREKERKKEKGRFLFENLFILIEMSDKNMCKVREDAVFKV